MTNSKPHPRTPGQVLAQQKLDAERDRLAAQQRAAQQPQNAMDRFAKPNASPQQAIVPVARQAIALPDVRTEHQKYLDEVAPSAIVGRPIKFDGKDGRFLYADTDESISPDTDFIAMLDETLVGWIRFHHDGETPPDRIQGILYDDFRMPPRDALGDMDKSRWELGLDGEPADPWLHQMNVVLQTPATLELATFRTTNKTGRRAVGNLLKHYDRMRRKDDNQYPVVRRRARLLPGRVVEKIFRPYPLNRRGPPFATWSSGTIGGLVGKADEMGVSDVDDGMQP
jgi:hypothetical protein